MSVSSLGYYIQSGSRFTRDGYEYDPSDDHWYIVGAGRGRHFRFDEMRKCLSSKLVDEVKIGLVVSLDKLAVATAQLHYRYFLTFLREMYQHESEVDSITGLDFVNFTQVCEPAYSKTLRRFLRILHNLGLGG